MKSAQPKQHYTISEIARLFDIGIDSLRYYERLGVMTPQRGMNGYRLYNLDDIYKLSLIKDLRRLDVPMRQIKEHLDNQTLNGTLDLLEQEEQLLNGRIKQLKADRESVREHLAELHDAIARPVGIVEVVEKPRRRCIQLTARIERDAEMDLLVQRLHREYERALPRLAMAEIGGELSEEDLAAERPNIYNSVFFVLEGAYDTEDAPCDLILEAGAYLTLRYRGPYEQNAAVYQELQTYAIQHDLAVVGAPYEFYEIDNRDTADPDEFLTRIELRVTK